MIQLHQKESRKLAKLRVQYLRHVYQKHLKTVLLTKEPQEDVKLNQALAYASAHPNCVDEFLSSRAFNEKEAGIIIAWKKEHYGAFHVLSMGEKGVALYDEKSNRLFCVSMIDETMTRRMLGFPMEYVIHGSLFLYKGQYMLDSVIQVDMKNDGTLEDAEVFYEDMRKRKETEGLSINETEIIQVPQSQRDASVALDEVLYDFIAPFGTVENLSLEMLRQVLLLAGKGWDEALMPGSVRMDGFDEQTKDMIHFFKQRKKTYFDDIKVVIKEMDVYVENNSVVMNLQTGQLKGTKEG